MGEIKLTLEDMISKLDEAAGRLIVSSMRDSVIRKAMEMITDVSIALGEVEEIKFYNYDDTNIDEE